MGIAPHEMVSLFLVVDVFREDLLPSTANTKFPKSRTGGTRNDLVGTLAAGPAVWSRGVSRRREPYDNRQKIRFKDVAGNPRTEILRGRNPPNLPH